MSVPAGDRAQLAEALVGLWRWAHDRDDHATSHNEVVALVHDALGEAGLARSVVTRELPPFEQVNVQVALDAWSAQPGRTVTVRGLALPPHHGSVSLQQLLHGHGLPPLRLSAPDLVDLPSGPHRTVACLRRALLLVTDARGSYVLHLRAPDPHEEPSIGLEVAGLPTDEAQDVLREIDEQRSTLNVYRGQVLELRRGRRGGLEVVFPVLPATSRQDVVLPEAVLRRIERHTVDIAERRQALRDAGQHLKRGLLLHGPPGTGKTHTTRYVVQRLAGSTVIMLSGQALEMIGAVTGLARELQPSVVVLEDVDLVAEDRGFGPGASPVLFELLDAMDGAAADADLLFLLTTNRADLLEPALAARPGRVDVAVEVGLPDSDARRRLFEVYSRGVPVQLDEAQTAEVVERTAGVTASFVKELLRRSVLEALSERAGPLEVVTAAHLEAALDDLLDSTQSVTRALLGGGGEGSPGGRAAQGHGGAWFPEPGLAPGYRD